MRRKERKEVDWEPEYEKWKSKWYLLTRSEYENDDVRGQRGEVTNVNFR